MKKADKTENKSMAFAILNRIEDVIEGTYAQLEDTVEHAELDVFLEGKTKLDGDKIDHDEDITPEQVALLGAYATVGLLVEAFKDIKAGKDVKIPRVAGNEPKITTELAVFSIEQGKKKPVKKQDMKHLPKEVKDALKRIMEEMENE